MLITVLFLLSKIAQIIGAIDDYNCLYYYPSDESTMYISPYIVQHEITEYCIRPDPRLSMENKDEIISEDVFSPCYIHLNCTNHCLDWREICDGKVDCIDTGEDEENCFELEMNECLREDEYRCHNGMHCIPKDFLRDNSLNPDCIDRSDEPALYSDYPDFCNKDSTFRCEEQICRPSPYDDHPCGNGQCVSDRYTQSCSNKRGTLLKHELFKSNLSNEIDKECFEAMACLTDSALVPCKDKCEKTSSCHQNIYKYCPSIPFPFPYLPVLYNHVYFVYSKNLSYFNRHGFTIPDYICFNYRLCSNMIFNSRMLFNLSDEIVCQDPIEDLHWSLNDYDGWFELVDYTRKQFRPCSLIYIDKFHCEKFPENFYRCKNSSKCISKYRLMDGIQDCYLNDDEIFTNSCQLKDNSTRFFCSNQKCLSLITIENGIRDCQENNDEIVAKEIISEEIFDFHKLCNGFIEFIDNKWNQTDESNCHWWLCKNLYTQCDGIWNCPNGEDELNCSYIPKYCPSMHHLCISPRNYSLTCLPIDRAGDRRIDCLGGTDERYLCRLEESIGSFHCLNENKCLDLIDVCDGKRDCVENDDENWCPFDFSLIQQNSCVPSEFDENELAQQTICFLHNEHYYGIYNSYFILHSNTAYLHETNKRINLINSYQDKQEVSSNEKTVIRCNRGLVIKNHLNQFRCLCSPAYYGNECQYHNQRVSLTIQIQVEIQLKTIFLLVFLLIDQYEQIESFEQIQYMAIRDCQTKWNIYLLYSSRPKNISRNYLLQIHVYEHNSFKHRASWLYPLKFSFLPVHRISIQILIPLHRRSTSLCLRQCQHGQCISYENQNSSFCLCEKGWKGIDCSIGQDDCLCPLNSICLRNDLRCLCSLDNYGDRCEFNHNVCQENSCHFHGSCLATDRRMLTNRKHRIGNFTCICSEKYSGEKCQQRHSEIEIRFHSKVAIPVFALLHFIHVKPHANPYRTTLLKRIPLDHQTVQIYTSIEFHLLFIEFFRKYYLLIQQNQYKSFEKISMEIQLADQCLNYIELFNETILKFNRLRRIKLYHLLCQEKKELKCFYDEYYMCLCNFPVRQANCFVFNHKMNYNCLGNQFCLNEGQCFQDDLECPQNFVCNCSECFFGTRCHLSTKAFQLSLEIIIGYQIRPNLSFSQQLSIIKFTITIIILMFICSSIANLLSILTFHRKKSKELACGLYLLTSSITSFLTIIIFTIQFLIILLSHLNRISNEILLNFLCKSINFILINLLHTTDWLNTCVAIERAVILLKGTQFNKKQSKRVFKYVVGIIFFFSLITTIHDPLNRRLFDDIEEQRVWCIVSYSDLLDIYSSIVYAFHFLTPFFLNLISTIIIIVYLTLRKKLTRIQEYQFQRVFFKQIRQHKHILIPPCILTLLSLPRFIIIFLSGCMKSTRDPWPYLLVYLISFVPPILHLFVFVLPSKVYKRELVEVIKCHR